MDSFSHNNFAWPFKLPSTFAKYVSYDMNALRHYYIFHHVKRLLHIHKYMLSLYYKKFNCTRPRKCFDILVGFDVLWFICVYTIFILMKYIKYSYQEWQYGMFVSLICISLYKQIELYLQITLFENKKWITWFVRLIQRQIQIELWRYFKQNNTPILKFTWFQGKIERMKHFYRMNCYFAYASHQKNKNKKNKTHPDFT